VKSTTSKRRMVGSLVCMYVALFLECYVVAMFLHRLLPETARTSSFPKLGSVTQSYRSNSGTPPPLSPQTFPKSLLAQKLESLTNPLTHTLRFSQTAHPQWSLSRRCREQETCRLHHAWLFTIIRVLGDSTQRRTWLTVHFGGSRVRIRRLRQHFYSSP